MDISEAVTHKLVPFVSLMLWIIPDFPVPVLSFPLPSTSNEDNKNNTSNSWTLSLFVAPPPSNSRPPKTRYDPQFHKIPQVFVKSPENRNDHSKDYDNVSDRSQRAALIMTFVLLSMTISALFGLYIAHVYYRRVYRIKRQQELYKTEQRNLVREISKPKRYKMDYINGIRTEKLNSNGDKVAQPAAPPAAGLQRWNSLMHVFGRFGMW